MFRARAGMNLTLLPFFRCENSMFSVILSMATMVANPAAAIPGRSAAAPVAAIPSAFPQHALRAAPPSGGFASMINEMVSAGWILRGLRMHDFPSQQGICRAVGLMIEEYGLTMEPRR